MTGAEHFAKAEQLLSEVDPYETDRGSDTTLAAAQVHATLALAAANAMPSVTAMCGDDDQITEWAKTIGWDLAWRPASPRRKP